MASVTLYLIGNNMFVGMNYIDGDFYPNRPDFSASVGMFPDSTEDEIRLAESCASWSNETDIQRIAIVYNFLEYIDTKFYFYWVMENQTSIKLSEKEFRAKIRECKCFLQESDDCFSGKTLVNEVDFFIILDKIFNSIFLGEKMILMPSVYRCTIQHLIKLLNKTDLPAGAINLLHIKG